MERSIRHPLDAITNNNPISMLETLIPFVDYPMKLPLALLIKAYEIRLIVQAFQSIDYLSRIGLHNPSKDPMDMLGSLTGISPDMLKVVMSMMNSQDATDNSDLLSSLLGGQPPPDLSSLFSNMQPSPDASAEPAGNPISHSNDAAFDDRIQQILSEYDMMQAAQLDEDTASPERR